MSSAKQFLKKYNENFAAFFKKRIDDTLTYNFGSIIVFQRLLTNSNIKYLSGLGYGVLLITPDKVRYPRFCKKLVRIGLMANTTVHRLIDAKRYFWVAWPSQYHIEKSEKYEKAAQAIQKLWRGLRGGSAESEDCYDDDFEDESEASAPEASDGETSDTETSEGESEAPMTSRCHVETMRCRNCWKNKDDGGNRLCWYENSEEQTNEQREAYKKFISLDTLYLTSSGGDVTQEREAAHRNFIQKIGGQTAERITAMRVVNEVIDDIDWNSSDDDTDQTGRAGRDNQGWINSLFRSAGY